MQNTKIAGQLSTMADVVYIAHIYNNDLTFS